MVISFSMVVYKPPSLDLDQISGLLTEGGALMFAQTAMQFQGLRL